MARLKHVYHADEIPHLWAHGIDRDIRNPLNNLYTAGDTIYSYGAHFPIARRVVMKDGSVVFLVNTDACSVTTNKHQWGCRLAMRDVGTVINIDPTTRAPGLYGRSVDTSIWDTLVNRKGASKPIVAWYQTRVDALSKEAAKPRIRYTTRENKIGEANQWYAEWVELHTLFKLRISIDAVKPPASVDATRAKYAKQYKAQVERDRVFLIKRRAMEIQAARIQAERAKVAMTYIEQWRADGTTPQREPKQPSLHDLGYPVLRIDGGKVRSSMGACVTVNVAKLVLKKAPECIGSGYSRETTVGDYRGFGATESHMRIGCHTIPWHEVRSFCEYYGWEVPDGTPA